jgi:hypothetical protein
MRCGKPTIPLCSVVIPANPSRNGNYNCRHLKFAKLKDGRFYQKNPSRSDDVVAANNGDIDDHMNDVGSSACMCSTFFVRVVGKS